MTSVPQAPAQLLRAVTRSPRFFFSMLDTDARCDLTARALTAGDEAASNDLHSKAGALAGTPLDDAARAAAQELLDTGACFTDDAAYFIDLYSLDWLLSYMQRCADYDLRGY